MAWEEGQRLSQTPAHVEAALIDAHWEYGSNIHLTSARALFAALGSEESDIATGHTLYSRLFGEYAGSLETYAAWAWSLRRRTTPGSFLTAYLSYGPGVVKKLYTLVENHDGDLSDLLRLPPAHDIVAAAVQQGEAHPDLTPEGYAKALVAQHNRLKTSAELYFQTDGVVVATFNKTKHGVPMVRLLDPDNPRAFEFVMKNPNATQEPDPPFRYAAFKVTRDSVAKILNNVQVLTAAISELAAITKVLLDAQMLYPAPGAEEGQPQ